MNPLSLNRIEIIEELRKHTTKPVLDKLLKRSTASLRGYLTYKLSPVADRKLPPEIPVLPKRVQGCTHTPAHTMQVFGICVEVNDRLPAHAIYMKRGMPTAEGMHMVDMIRDISRHSYELGVDLAGEKIAITDDLLSRFRKNPVLLKRHKHTLWCRIKNFFF